LSYCRIKRKGKINTVSQVIIKIYPNLEVFKGAWVEINGKWDPHERVWVYEFVLVKDNTFN